MRITLTCAPNMNPYSSFLFARPSFAEGAARALDLGGTLQEYNGSLSPQQADATALRMDWRAIGEDLPAAMNEVGGAEQVALSEELIAQARAVLEGSGQLELQFSDGS